MRWLQRNLLKNSLPVDCSSLKSRNFILLLIESVTMEIVFSWVWLYVWIPGIIGTSWLCCVFCVPLDEVHIGTWCMLLARIQSFWQWPSELFINRRLPKRLLSHQFGLTMCDFRFAVLADDDCLVGVNAQQFSWSASCFDGDLFVYAHHHEYSLEVE